MFLKQPANERGYYLKKLSPDFSAYINLLRQGCHCCVHAVFSMEVDLCIKPFTLCNNK